MSIQYLLDQLDLDAARALAQILDHICELLYDRISILQYGVRLDEDLAQQPPDWLRFEDD